jgi:hypothetical protein
VFSSLNGFIDKQHFKGRMGRDGFEHPFLDAPDDMVTAHTNQRLTDQQNRKEGFSGG